MTLAVQACAKINLCLKVIGRRPDGLHDIVSIVQTVALHDDLVFEPRDGGISLQVDASGVPDDQTNLAWRAALALPPPPGGPRGAAIAIRKRIPAGAGLGGGSSDAAATLVALNRLWGLGLPPGALAGIGATLGADIPYFLTGGTALVTGTGTTVKPLRDRLGYLLLLVFPGVAVSTGTVYERLGAPLTSAREISRMARFWPALEDDSGDGIEAWVRAGNDLAACARGLCPVIEEIEGRLVRAGARVAAMTGSGSTVFGVFTDPAALERAAREMEEAGLVALRSAPIGRREYQRNLGVA